MPYPWQKNLTLISITRSLIERVGNKHETLLNHYKSSKRLVFLKVQVSNQGPGGSTQGHQAPRICFPGIPSRPPPGFPQAPPPVQGDFVIFNLWNLGARNSGQDVVAWCRSIGNEAYRGRRYSCCLCKRPVLYGTNQIDGWIWEVAL